MISRRLFLGTLTPAVAIAATRPPVVAAEDPFRHGIASGDPLHTQAIIWTRISAPVMDIEVQWQVSRDEEFSSVTASGMTKTGVERDFTVKVDVGDLTPDTRYFYRFAVGDNWSDSGQFRTLPLAGSGPVRLAVVSCSNYPAGYFNVYREVARQRELNAVIHLGDYLYEYPADGYATENSVELGRVTRPAHEIVSLSDYRSRYAQYRSDPDLQAAHASAAFIVSWDDHETANDSWSDGAENHNDGEGSWASRRDAALRAFYEWMPVREPDTSGRAENYRSFEFGNIVTLAMIESRLSGRSKPINYATDLPMRSTWYQKSADGKATPIENLSGVDRSTLKRVKTPYDVRSGEPVPIMDYARATELNATDLPDGFVYIPDTEQFYSTTLRQPDSTLLGDTQFSWLANVFGESSDRGVIWQLLGNQTIVAPLTAPNLHAALSPQQKAAVPERLQGLLPLTRYELPLNLDSWDGYPAERDRLYAILSKQTNNALVITGDTHNAWANRLLGDDSSDVGLEIGTPSVSSPGVAEALNIPGEKFSSLIKARNPHVEYAEFDRRGYVLLTLDSESARADYVFVDTILSKNYRSKVEKTIVRNARAPHKTRPEKD